MLLQAGKVEEVEKLIEQEAEREAEREKAGEVAAASPAAEIRSGFPAAFRFLPSETYRIHFRNGNSGEYQGAALVHGVPFDVSEVQTIELVGDN
jgi:hypothetical protein